MRALRALFSQRFQVQPMGLSAPSFNIFRAFADQVKGSFLDKSEVEARVLEAVKKFDKARQEDRRVAFLPHFLRVDAPHGEPLLAQANAL